ncbi:MAG: multidrug transporter, partial [Leptolyngbya sp. SIO1D8]|nr:multidrug transporter [Leptolyngbya sp. SIO1D8]
MNEENPSSQVPLESQNPEMVRDDQNNTQNPEVTSPIRESEAALPAEHSSSLPKPKKSLWPVITLAMLVVAGLVGWRIYSG